MVVTLSTGALADTGQAAANTPTQRFAALALIGRGNEPSLGRPYAEDAVDPNANRNAGSGFAQSTLVSMKGLDGNQYIVVLVMESTDNEMYGMWQISCTSWRLSANEAPVATVTRQLLTHNPGERAAMHPKATVSTLSDGSAVIPFTYGSRMGGNRTATYVSVTNERCEKMVPDTLVSLKADLNSQNDGAPDIADHGNGRFTVAYLSTGGNNDATYLTALQLMGGGARVTLSQLYDPVMVISPANIGRPALLADGADRAIVCASKDGNGSRRPPGGGVECARVGVTMGNTIWKATVADAVVSDNPYQRSYMGQPSIASLGDGMYALNVNESNGASKNNNNSRDLKGSNTAHLYYLTLNKGTEALEIKGNIVGAATFQTHSAICSGAFGVNGTPTVNVLSASPIGIGRASMLMVHFDPTQATPFSFDPAVDHWPANWNGDSGWMFNRLGQNPGNQGRDFMRCIGDVPNPGHGVKDGFMPDVETFFAAAVPGRIPGDSKNSLFLTLLPAKTDTPGTPVNPQDIHDVPLGNPSPAPAPTTQTTTGCGCVVVGDDSRVSTGAAVALFGVVIAAVSRRRRRGQG